MEPESGCHSEVSANFSENQSNFHFMKKGESKQNPKRLSTIKSLVFESDFKSVYFFLCSSSLFTASFFSLQIP